jgi:hypothetical protein
MRADEMPGAKNDSGRKPHVFIAIVLCIHLTICFLVLAKNVSHPGTSERLVSSDSVHYVDIARDLSSGDFSMQYVKQRPHRQPLYPALLAIAMKLGNGNRFMLGAVNIVLEAVSIISVYLFAITLFQNRFAASVSALALAANPFMDRTITARLLTEPLHLLLTLWAIFAFLTYLRGKDWRWLFTCAAFLGLDYLTRPNGLFMAAAAIGTMALSDLLNYWSAPQNRPSLIRWLTKHAGLYLAAAAVFLVVAIPSWVPRLVYYGSPFHHGYLENFMWVDTYKEGHVGQSFAIYTWRDYFAHHHGWDILKRVIHGLWNVYFHIPIWMERIPILYLLSIGGVWIAFRFAGREFRFLCLFLVLQMQPLVWTNLSNPTARVPYGSLLPFELFLATLFLAWASEQPRIRSWLAERFLRRNSPPAVAAERL